MKQLLYQLTKPVKIDMKSNLNIDELLKESFLELDPNNPANDQLFDMASRNAFDTEWNISSHAKAIKSKSSIFSNWKLYLGVFAAISIITFVVLFFPESNINNSTLNKVPTAKVELNQEKQFSHNNVEEKKFEIAHTQSQNKTSVITDYINTGAKERTNSNLTLPKEVISSQAESLSNSNNIENLLQEDISIRYKTFSSWEISEINEKINQLSIKLTSKLGEEFPMIPGAAGYSNGKTFQGAFYMWPTEITVGEYELFLNDLLIKKKYSEFELFRPNLNNGFGSKLSDEDISFFHQYFSDSKYADYPVVFVSPEGADAFCKWLEELINLSSGSKDKNATVRLPGKWEWERAAAGGKEHIDYGTSDGQLIAGFIHHSPEANFRDYQQNDFSFAQQENLKKVNKSFKADTKKFHFTTAVRTFKANPYGLYDMSGNVSEMVVDLNGKIVTKGGNWNSSKEFLRIRDDDFNEYPMGAFASPFIGFRPIVNFK